MSLEVAERELQDKIVLLAPKGVVDHFSHPKLQAAIEKLLQAKKSRIAIDLAGVEYMSSAGVGILINYREEARKLGGDLAAFSPGPRVKAALDVLGIEYRATREEALAALGPIRPAP